MSEESKSIKIDGKSYEVDKLSKEAKKLVVAIRQADQMVARLKMETALCQTARTAYFAMLKKNIG